MAHWKIHASSHNTILNMYWYTHTYILFVYMCVCVCVYFHIFSNIHNVYLFIFFWLFGEECTFSEAFTKEANFKIFPIQRCLFVRTDIPKVVLNTLAFIDALCSSLGRKIRSYLAHDLLAHQSDSLHRGGLQWRTQDHHNNAKSCWISSFNAHQQFKLTDLMYN